MSSAAAGGSLTGVTVPDTVAVAVSAPSVTAYVKVAAPL
jgi:hypothetical protein